MWIQKWLFGYRMHAQQRPLEVLQRELEGKWWYDDDDGIYYVAD